MQARGVGDTGYELDIVLGHRFEITIDYRFIIGKTKPTSYRLCNRLN